MSLIQKFNNFNKINFNKFLSFKIVDTHVGYIHIKFAKYLYKYFSKNFVISSNNIILKNIDNTINYINLSKFFDDIAIFLLNKKIIKKITNEYFEVVSLDDFTNLFKIERNLLNLFSILSKGVHLNGYVKLNNKIYIWIAKRSKNKLLYPGKLDNITAGGISKGYDALNTLFKEALEEANIENNIVKNAIFSTKLHYFYPFKNGIRNDVMYIYNLELPLNFTPKTNDGEVEQFCLLEAEEVLNILKESTQKIKFNSAISIIYFLIEKNLINQSNTNIRTIKIIKEKFDKMQNSRLLKYL